MGKTARIDPFTRRRLERFVEDFRAKSGELPTLADFSSAGFEKARIEDALKDRILSEFYITLTNGVVKKGYKLFQGEE